MIRKFICHLEFIPIKNENLALSASFSLVILSAAFV